MYSEQALKMIKIFMGRFGRGGCCEMKNRVHRGTWAWGIVCYQIAQHGRDVEFLLEIYERSCQKWGEAKQWRALNALMKDLTLEEEVSIFCGLSAMIMCKPVFVMFLWIRWIIILMGGFITKCVNGTGGVQHQSEIVKGTKLLPWVLLLGHMFLEGRDLVCPVLSVLSSRTRGLVREKPLSLRHGRKSWMIICSEFMGEYLFSGSEFCHKWNIILL